MDLGRARYRQAHKMPPQKWEQALFMFLIFVSLVLLASWIPTL